MTGITPDMLRKRENGAASWTKKGLFVTGAYNIIIVLYKIRYQIVWITLYLDVYRGILFIIILVQIRGLFFLILGKNKF